VTWFQKMMGFEEEGHASVHRNISIDGNQMRSLVNGQSHRWGELEQPSLAGLRERVSPLLLPSGQESTLDEVVGNVQELHCESENRNALFQVASQFNLLEMVGPSVTPERGVGCYENDRTQGPACAIAAGAGTIYRNYFVETEGGLGQTASRQIDCLSDLGETLGNRESRLWTMRNGYALASGEGLAEIRAHLERLNEAERSTVGGMLRIGLQWGTEVTLPHAAEEPLLVSQAYCSALPVAYSRQHEDAWEPFARLVLDASYEACLAAALLNQAATGSNKVYLTLLGGGAFGNRMEWITDALLRAMRIYRYSGLDVSVVSYGRSSSAVQSLLGSYSGSV
jgi:hypothetical protein